MHKREYKKLRSVIEADYRKKIEALELVYGMAGKNGASTASSPVRGEPAKAVVAAIQQQTNGEFNVATLRKPSE